MFYVYTIRHIPSGRKYIGSRCKAEYVDILKEYFTSSLVVKLLIKEDGLESFEVESIIECPSIETCVALEDKMLRSVSKESELYLNVNFTAHGAVIRNQTHTSITKGDGVFMYYPRGVKIPEGWHIEWPCPPPSQKGKRWYLNPETKETKMLYPNSENIPSGFVLKTEYYKKIKDEVPRRSEWITDGTTNAKIGKDEMPPQNWRFGKSYKKKPSGRPKGGIGYSSTTGTWTITDGETVKYVPPETPIPEGWYRGNPSGWHKSGKRGSYDIKNKKI